MTKDFLSAVVAALLLAGCGGGAPGSTAETIKNVAYATCGVAPTVASVIAITATGNPLAGAPASVVVAAICDAYKAHTTIATLEASADQCVKVGDVCIQVEKVDKDKLRAHVPSK